MNTLTIKQKRVIENNNVTVEMIEQGEDAGYIFLIAGCYNQQKPKSTEHEAYLSAIEYITKRK
jgi:hypothetical protein